MKRRAKSTTATGCGGSPDKKKEKKRDNRLAAPVTSALRQNK
jgi:hypothetical protein